MIIINKPIGKSSKDLFNIKAFQSILSLHYFSISIFIKSDDGIRFAKFFKKGNNYKSFVVLGNNSAVAQAAELFLYTYAELHTEAVVIFSHENDPTMPHQGIQLTARDIGATVMKISETYSSNSVYLSTDNRSFNTEPEMDLVFFSISLNGIMKKSSEFRDFIKLKGTDTKVYSGPIYSSNDVLCLAHTKDFNLGHAAKRMFSSLLSISPKIYSLNSRGAKGMFIANNEIVLINKQDFLKIDGIYFSTVGDFDTIKSLHPKDHKARFRTVNIHIFFNLIEEERIIIYIKGQEYEIINFKNELESIELMNTVTYSFTNISFTDLIDPVFIKKYNVTYRINKE